MSSWNTGTKKQRAKKKKACKRAVKTAKARCNDAFTAALRATGTTKVLHRCFRAIDVVAKKC